MEPMTRRSHPLSRQEIKEIMRMPVPIFRKWIMTYSMTVYNLGVDDCKEILHDEFGQLVHKCNDERTCQKNRRPECEDSFRKAMRM